MASKAKTNRQWHLRARPTGLATDRHLSLDETPLEPLSEGEARIRVLFLSLDPTNRIWMSDQEQYMPPVAIGDVMRGIGIGRVVESRLGDLPEGTLVSGLTGWQEYVTVDAATAKGFHRLPEDPALPITAFGSALGMTGQTAYFGLIDIGQPKPGETLVVSAASGAVGSLVGQIGKIKGCRVIGITGSDEKCTWLRRELGFDATINYRTQDVKAMLRELCPKGIDIYFDNTGGAILDAVLANLALFARIPLCGLISGYNAEKPVPGPYYFPMILMKRATVRGFIVSDYAARYGESASAMADWLKKGLIKDRVDVREGGIGRALETMNLLFSGEKLGKLLLKVADD